MSEEKLNIAVVCGSVRENRASIDVAKFLVKQLEGKGAEVVLVDFKDFPLPFVYTPEEPSKLKGNYPDENVKRWSNIAKAADGFVFVAPEYNHGYTGVMKTALDWLYHEFERKAAGLVGVSSGMVGGARVIEQLRPIMGNYSMYDIKETIMVRNAAKTFDSSGALIDEELLKQVPKFIDSLLFAARALKQARDNK